MLDTKWPEWLIDVSIVMLHIIFHAHLVHSNAIWMLQIWLLSVYLVRIEIILIIIDNYFILFGRLTRAYMLFINNTGGARSYRSPMRNVKARQTPSGLSVKKHNYKHTLAAYEWILCERWLLNFCERESIWLGYTIYEYIRYTICLYNLRMQKKITWIFFLVSKY